MSKWRTARVHREHPTSGILLHVPRDSRSTLPSLDEDVLVQIRRPRNIKHHRLYWALINEVAESTGRWPSAEALHRWVKWKLEMYRPVAVKNELVVLEWESTDFASMGQDEFRTFFERAINTIAEETGIDPEALRKEPF